MLVEGVHYLPDDPPGDVAWKLVDVNLSDLAAKGARPLGVLLLTPPFSWIAKAAYRWIANNRDRMPGGTAACALPQEARERLYGPATGPETN